MRELTEERISRNSMKGILVLVRAVGNWGREPSEKPWHGPTGGRGGWDTYTPDPLPLVQQPGGVRLTGAGHTTGAVNSDSIAPASYMEDTLCIC